MTLNYNKKSQAQQIWAYHKHQPKSPCHIPYKTGILFISAKQEAMFKSPCIELHYQSAFRFKLSYISFPVITKALLHFVRIQPCCSNALEFIIALPWNQKETRVPIINAPAEGYYLQSIQRCDKYLHLPIRSHLVNHFCIQFCSLPSPSKDCIWHYL